MSYFKRFIHASALAGLCLSAAVCSAQETVWSMPLEGTGISATIAPVKYGKLWCYSVELDDGGVNALIMDKLLADKFYTDAPTGVPGGQPRRFVGDVALIGCSLDKNSTVLSTPQVKQLQANGWGVTNHGYWHTGCHWDLSKRPDRAQFDREVFWSQILFSNLYYDGLRAPAHHVYPNGDWAYDESLKKYGLHSGALVGGQTYVMGGSKNAPFRLGRSYLDEGSWKNGGKGDPLWGYSSQPQAGTVLLDFTHGISDKPDSDNFKRWTARIETIAREHGKAGKDDVWVAPVQEMIAYDELARASKATVENGTLTVRYPTGQPGSPLTLVLSGVPENAKIAAPEGGLLYRQGTTVWLTTPFLGEREAPVPMRLKMVWEGKFQPEVTLPETIKFAGVRFLQSGGGKPEDFKDVKVSAEIVSPEGQVTTIPQNVRWSPLAPQWGYWDVISPLPGAEPLPCKTVRMTPLKFFEKMQIWAAQ